MARSFSSAATDRLVGSAAWATAAPLSMGCWFYTTSSTLRQFLMMVAVTTNNDNRFSLELRGDVGGDPLHALTEASASSSQAVTSSGYSVNTWQHGLAVFAASNDRRVYLNGGSKGTESTSRSPVGLNKCSIGAFSGSSNSLGMEGLIAEAGVWSAALTDAEAEMLAAGVPPYLVQPQSLVAYYPLYGAYSAEIDCIGRIELTVTGAVQASDHPRVWRPGRSRVFLPTSLNQTVGGGPASAAWAAAAALVAAGGVTAAGGPGSAAWAALAATVSPGGVAVASSPASAAWAAQAATVDGAGSANAGSVARKRWWRD